MNPNKESKQMTRRAKSVLDHATRNVLLMDLVRRGFNMDPKDPPAAEPPADKKGDKKGDPEPDADKVTLTKAELEAKVNEAAANAVRKANEAAEKKRKDAEDEAARKKAEEQGEYQKLAEASSQAGRKETRSERRRIRIQKPRGASGVLIALGFHRAANRGSKLKWQTLHL
jgi:vacuolar-type H+-ATPase subunit H